jgi:hypothetical protein
MGIYVAADIIEMIFITVIGACLVICLLIDPKGQPRLAKHFPNVHIGYLSVITLGIMGVSGALFFAILLLP